MFIQKLKITNCRDMAQQRTMNAGRHLSDETLSENENEEPVPLSPTSEWMLYSRMCGHSVVEMDGCVDTASLRQFALAVYNQFPRASCIAKEDEEGNIRLYRTQIDMDKHLVFVELAEEDEEKRERAVEEYIAKMETMKLERSKPQWEVHVLRCAARTVCVFKFHHSLGDGVSMMSSLFALAQSVQDPSRKPALPRFRAPLEKKLLKEKLQTPFMAVADVADLALRMLGCRRDHVFPHHRIMKQVTTDGSGADHRSVFIPLPVIKSIKNTMSATVNDVISGIIFHAFKRYLDIRDAAAEAKVTLMQVYEKRSELFSSTSAMIQKRQGKTTKFTALVPLNTRAIAALLEMQETTTEKPKVSWGNHFVPIFIDISLKTGDSACDAISRTKRIFDSKKKSTYLQLGLMPYLPKYFNPKTTAKSFQRAFGSASLVISNLVGPAEKISVNSNTIKHFRFFGAPVPLALRIYITSYVDDMILNVVALKPFMDIHIFCECLQESFAEVTSKVTTTISEDSHL